MSSIPNETQLTYNNMRADFDGALSEENKDLAQELITAFRDYSSEEADRWQQELNETNI